MPLKNIGNKSNSINKSVVMGCTHPYWSSLQVGSQHLARQFARNGWQVYYFSAPVSLLHLPQLFRFEVIKRLKKSFQYYSSHENGMIHSHVPFSLIAPDGRYLLRSPIVTHNWHKLMIPRFKRVLKKSQHKKFDLLYIDNLSYQFFLEQLAYEKSVFRVMDMHERFSGWNGEALKLAKNIAYKADLTVYSAEGLSDYVDSLGVNRAMFLPNGVDFNLFQKRNFSVQKHPLLLHIPDPIILYTGMIDSRLDYRLIRAAAARLPGVSFVFTGVLEDPGHLRNMSGNVYYTGPVSHKELPWLMKSAKAGIIPFDAENKMDSIKGIRPLKLLEYFAAGIPVVCAIWPELEKMNSPAWLYADETEFVELVRKLTCENSYNAHKELNFAGGNDWAKIFQKLLRATQEI